MAPRASGANPQYHLKLTDGVQTVGIIASAGKKPSVGAIRRFPRGPGVERKSAKQQTWIGGRGNLRFATDTSRFADSGALVTTVPGQLISGPQARYATGFRAATQDLPGSGFLWYYLYPGDGNTINHDSYLARSFTPASSYSADRICLWIARTGTPTAALTVELCSDNAGAPGTVLKSATVDTTTITDTLAVLYPFDFSGTQALTSGTKYWIKVYDTTAGATVYNCWRVGCAASTAGDGIHSTNGSSWTGTFDLYYRVDDANHATAGSARFFEYKRALYLVTQPEAGGAAKLYLNGDRGLASGTQSTTTLNDSAKSWTTNEFAGCIVLFTQGVNKGKWRTITANDSDTLTITPALAVACAAGSGGTQYVILGSDKWTEIGSTGLTAPVTGVTVAKGFLYLAQGDAVNIRRMREYDNAGTWTREFTDDGSSKATLLTTFTTGGTTYVYRANNSDVTFSRAPGATSWTDLAFETAQPAGDSEGNITALVPYDNSVKIGKEDAVGQDKDYQWNDLPVPIQYGRDENNCVNMKGWNVYLYFPYMEGFERLYGTTIDDIGPNRDQGLPADRRGRIADFVPVHQYGYAAVDAGAGYSSVLMTTSPGGDWHEIYRAPQAARPIRSLFYQSIPGLANRLWFFEGWDVGYVMRERDTQSPTNDSNMRYAFEGYVTTSWFDFDTPELDHYWDELRLFSKTLADGSGYVRVDYQVDNDTAWTAFNLAAADGGQFIVSPYQKIAIGSGLVTGRRIRFRLVATIADLSTPIVLSAFEVRGNQLNEVLYDYIVDFSAGDRLVLLNGEDARESAVEVLEVLESWQEDATPLTAEFVVGAPWDAITCHLDPVALVPSSWTGKRTRWSGSLTLKQT